MGPLLFCLSTYQLTTQLTSHLKVFYLDDGTLGSNVDNVIHNLSIVEEIARQLGLRLNRGKSEVIYQDPGTLEKFLSVTPRFQVTSFEKVSLLGSPLSNYLDESIIDKVRPLRVLKDRDPFIQAHDSILLLDHSLAVLRILYLLHTAPCFGSSQLQVFDEALKRVLSSVCSISF